MVTGSKIYKELSVKYNMKSIGKELIGMAMMALITLGFPAKIPLIKREDVGQADMTIDSQGNVIRRVTRPVNYDLVTITEKGPDGRMYSRGFVPERYR